MFESLVNLVKNNRVDKSDPDSMFVTKFLLHLWDGKVTEEDRKKILLKFNNRFSQMGTTRL
jgi:hypothetical protein